jgi:uncharacterized protein YraI
MKSLRRAFLATVIALLCVLGFQTPVNAGSAAIRIAATNGLGVNVRTGPSTAYPVAGKIPEGVSPNYICYTNGERIGGGPGVGTTLWFRASYKGVTGYYSSAYDTVPYSWQTNIEGHYGISRCNGLPLPAVGRYNRQAAANWAIAHARDAQPMFPVPGCAWFASQALWAGGLPKTSGWTDTGIKNPPRAATFSPSLVQYLQSDAGIAEVIPLTDNFASGSVPQAQLGDLIVYSWDGDGVIDHSSVVVHIGKNYYPDVAEWGTASGGGSRSSYVWRGWTWSENNKTWLQSYNDTKATIAWLVHIK